jgi:hypothetical protein
MLERASLPVSVGFISNGHDREILENPNDKIRMPKFGHLSFGFDLSFELCHLSFP